MQTAKEVRDLMLEDIDNWSIHLMNFVDDLRREKASLTLETPLDLRDERFDALMASTVEYLCREQELEVPQWVFQVPHCQKPWFVSGLESLKAIAIVESPVEFRLRKIFVLENFLHRV